MGWTEQWRRLFEGDGDNQILRVEEFHEDGVLVVRAEMPGIDPEKDVEVTTADGMVTIHARREEEAERKDKRGYRSEFRYGEFDRQVMLPEGVSGADVKATYKDGILEVRIPCPQTKDKEPTTVPVTRS
jgi:HSP20 family protein